MTIVEQLLGYRGRIISSSKSRYREAHPNHLVVFNANLCTGDGTKIWYGDLDLHVDRRTLLDLAEKLREDIYVLQEMDGRFENEQNPRIDQAIVTFHPEGRYAIKEQIRQYYPDLGNE